MPLTFRRGRESTRDDLYLKFLLYGHSGAGKTWMASTAPRAIVLLTERNGEQSVRLSNPDAPYAIVSSIDEVREFLRAAQAGALGSESEPIETIVIDGLTEIQRLMKDEMIATREDGEMTISMWGELTEKMRRLLRMLRDLPYHVVATALADTEMEADVRHTFPSFQGKKLADEVSQYFNAVGYVYRKPGEKASEPLVHVAMFDGPSRYTIKNSHPLRGTREGPISAWVEEMRAAEGTPATASTSKAEAAPEAAPEATEGEKAEPARKPLRRRSKGTEDEASARG